MSLTITEWTPDAAGHISSTASPHTAIGITARTWYASWLHAEPLSRDQAVTAMTIADLSAGLAAEQGKTGSSVPDDPRWDSLAALASELGLPESRAFVLATDPPPQKRI